MRELENEAKRSGSAPVTGGGEHAGRTTIGPRRDVAGVVLILYRFSHALLFSPLVPRVTPDGFPLGLRSSWALVHLSDAAAVPTIGSSLWIATTMGFMIAGRWMLGQSLLSDHASDLAGAAAIVSVLLIVLFGHSWVLAGLVFDLIILALVWRGYLQPSEKPRAGSEGERRTG